LINILLVASGGAIGATIRFLSTSYIKYLFPTFPIGTLVVNIIGSFSIGFLISVMENRNISSNIINYFVIIGFLGSFTTFSAFSFEVIDMINNKRFFLSVFYIFSSLLICFFCCYSGYNINKIQF
jgi:CrcB protein